jgi:hypothetical protein
MPAYPRRYLLSLFVFLFTLAASSLQAASYDKGLLWKIERDGARPSYVFGTMHSDDPRVLRLPPEVQRPFDASASYTMEVLMDLQAMAEMSQAMMFTDGRTLKGVLGAELYSKAAALMERRGLPAAALNEVKPWAIYVTLSMPPTASGDVLDLSLYNAALAGNKPVFGLESATEQLSVFDQLTMSEQVELVAEIVEHHDQVAGMIEEMRGIYLKRDLAGLERFAAKYNALMNPKLSDKLMDKLIDARNARMVERMLPRLKEGNAFIAVGALHLPGERGILNLLAQRGYRVSVVY